MQLKFQKELTLDRSKRKNYTAQVSEVKPCIRYTAQVPEGANLYPSKRNNYTAQVSEVKTCILFQTQVPEGANLYRSKRKSYTAQVSEVKTLYTVYSSSSRRS